MATGIDGDQRYTLYDAVIIPTNSVADGEHETGPDHSVNANVSEELTGILSRSAALLRSPQNVEENLTTDDGTVPIHSTALLFSQTSTTGVHRQSSSVPDVPIAARSAVSRGRLRSTRAAWSRDRGRPLPSSTTQPLPGLLAYTSAADLPK